MSEETKSTPFMIIAAQRTGSTWLMDMLDDPPTIASYNELLIAGGQGSCRGGRDDIEFFVPYYVRHRKHPEHRHRFARILWSFRYLDELYALRRGIQATGMKLMYDQLHGNPWVLIYIMRHRVRILHLVRNNLLDILVSGETAEARRRYHAFEGDVVETSAVTLEPTTLVSRLRTLERHIKVVRWLLSILLIKHLEISYEDLSADPSLTYEGVLRFLDVPTPADGPAPISKLKKLNTSRKRDLIANYVEVERVLKGTRFECFLVE